MRAKLVVLLLALAAGSLTLVPTASAVAGHGHRHHQRPEVTLAFSAPTYMTSDRPVLTYTWKHREHSDSYELQILTNGVWTRLQRLHLSGHRGTGTRTLSPRDMGSYSYRAVAVRRGNVRAKAEASMQVYGPVPVTKLIRATPSSNATVHSGVVQIGGQPFTYTFERYLTGASIWRSIVDIPSTSCQGIGIPLASRRRDSSTGGTFSMRAVSTGDVVITANAAAPDVAAGLLSPVTVGARLAVQVMSDRDVDYFGAGQAICYTKDGRA